MAETNFYGQNDAYSALQDSNLVDFQIQQALRAVSTATIVKVQKVSVAGVVGPIGTLSALPLVDLVDGIGQESKHVDVVGLPYLRMQAGRSAIIMDPKVGDLGLVVFADRDVSAVKKNKKQSPPGSRRRFNMADGIYVGTVLSSENPDVYIRFMEDGTVVVGNAKASESQPMECVVGRNFAQMKWKGVSDMHVTVDQASGQIIVGKPVVVAPDPYPNY